MAREVPGWVKLHSSILDKGLNASQFKAFVGLILQADTCKAARPGLVDLPIREIAKRLNMSVGAFIEADDLPPVLSRTRLFGLGYPPALMLVTFQGAPKFRSLWKIRPDVSTQPLISTVVQRVDKDLSFRWVRPY